MVARVRVPDNHGVPEHRYLYIDRTLGTEKHVGVAAILVQYRQHSAYCTNMAVPRNPLDVLYINIYVPEDREPTSEAVIGSTSLYFLIRRPMAGSYAQPHVNNKQD